MLQRNEEGELNHFGSHAQENGVDVTNNHRYAPSSTSRSSLGNYSALLSLSRMNSKEEDCNLLSYLPFITTYVVETCKHVHFTHAGHGSSLSLVSTASSLYSSQEEKQASEIRKLRRELAEAHEKVNTLSGQLSTNVSAFRQFFILKSLDSARHSSIICVLLYPTHRLTLLPHSSSHWPA